VRLLLDTHIALWALVDSPRLPAKARLLILAPDNEVVVSAASVWEIAIKHGLAKKNMPVSGAEAKSWFTRAGYTLLPVTADHAALVEELPPHHADPFDRILIAQALDEPLRLVTHDPTVARYSDTVILV
jgi:PIN domain nuclease of toxin-antitoxin system